MSQDPVRLDLADDAPDLAREALSLARRDAPGADRLRAIEAGVLARLSPPTPDGGGGTDGGGSPTGGGASSIVKAGAAALAVAAAVGAIVVVSRSSEAPPVVEPPTASTTQSLPSARVVEPSSSIPTLAVSSLPSALPTTRGRPVPSASTSVDPADSERAEVALLDSAQASLGPSPDEALRKLDEHARRFPNGTLVQEREVMAIDALLRLGRRTDAESRAQRFKKAHARSGHLRRIDALLAD